MTRTWKVVGIDFDHMHMGDNLRMAHEHPRVEIAGICDAEPARMQSAREAFGIPEERAFTDWRECLEKTAPDLVLLCPRTGRHGVWTERVAEYGVHVIMEKPFAASLDEADAMIEAVAATGKELVINWPLRWSRPHVTTKRLIDEGVIGDVIEIHYYDGNRGPLWHLADKIETTQEFVNEQKATAWWYRQDAGGGSQLDYMGYGTTLGTWFLGGRKPVEVTSVALVPPGLEVDEHSITIARYDFGLSKFETRWGTFSDPWVHQPQPRCGFQIHGTEGTIGCWDYADTVTLQTAARPEQHTVPADELAAPERDPIEYVIDRLERSLPIEGPLSPELCRIGQQIIDSAVLSAREGRTVELLGC